MLAVYLGTLTLLYWLCFGIVIVGDLYLSYPEMGMVVKVLFPLAVLCNYPSGEKARHDYHGNCGTGPQCSPARQRLVFLFMALLLVQDVSLTVLTRE